MKYLFFLLAISLAVFVILYYHGGVTAGPNQLKHFESAVGDDVIDTLGLTNVTTIDQEVSDTEPVKEQETFPVGETVYYSSTTSLRGKYAVEDVSKTFYEYIDRAKKGDPAASQKIHEVLDVCIGTALASAMLKLRRVQDEVLISQVNDVDQECTQVITEGSGSERSIESFEDVRAWDKEMLDVAEDAGIAIAILEKNFPEHGYSEKYYSEAVELLENAVRDGHYAGFEYAAEFYTDFHHTDGADVNRLEASKWAYLSCQKNAQCDSSALRHNFSLEFSVSQLTEIDEFELVYDARKRSGEAFGFGDSWLPYYSYSLVETDGSNYSEVARDGVNDEN